MIVDVFKKSAREKFEKEIVVIICGMRFLFLCFVFTENCLQMNNFVGITGPPLLFTDNSPPNSVATSSVTRHKKVFFFKY